MDYIANSEEQKKAMFATLGISSVEELFVAVPKALMLSPPSEEDGISEFEGISLIEEIAQRNSAHLHDCYLGGGAYEHHIPAIVDAICQKSEFLTAYTPYQAEASQGMLQAIFEFQSCISALTGMESANASVYDAASACAEAMLMALRHQKGRKRLLISAALNPSYRDVVEQYLSDSDAEIITLPVGSSGAIDIEAARELVTSETAGLLIQSPNYYGTVEESANLFGYAKEKGVVTILCADPLSYGLFASAQQVGADIAVGDCQPLGLALNFGGPYAGYIACRGILTRQLPGRLIGETVDSAGERGFVLTLQAREQHIRRGKATSNICTNQGLAALASLVTMLWYGEEGVKELALANYQRTCYLREKLSSISGIALYNSGTIFNEFVIKSDFPTKKLLAHFLEKGIEAGIAIDDNHLLIAVTETKNIRQLDRYVEVMEEASKKYNEGCYG